MGEINLMRHYPAAKRAVDERAKSVTDEEREMSRQFGEEYFDGDRRMGYGGYHYHPRFWRATVELLSDHYRLANGSSMLDVGCAKGFMLHDFKQLMPDLRIAGIDISEYAIENAIDTVKPYVRAGNARDLPYEDNSFDLVTAISTVHNLPLADCKQAIREIQRVSRSDAFITVDAWRTQEEKERLEKWILTCRTYMHVDDWQRLFAEIGYAGDYYWFIVE